MCGLGLRGVSVPPGKLLSSSDPKVRVEPAAVYEVYGYGCVFYDVCFGCVRCVL